MPKSAPADSRIVFVVAGEDRGHFEAVTLLVDRVLGEHVAWAADMLEHVRTWLPDRDRPWFSLKDAYAMASARQLPVYGHFDGKEGLDEARMFRAQLLLWKLLRKEGEAIDAVILVRDLDGRARRRLGMEQAIACEAWPFVVIGAWCQPEVEAWLLCGFAAESEFEQDAQEELRGELSFSPVAQPERLCSTDPNALHDAKRVVTKLIGDEPIRRRRCLERPLAELKARGEKTGLAPFLKDVEARLVPLLARRQS